MTIGPDSTCVVLHDLGDAAAGGPWRVAFAEAPWPGIVIAPDLPGHAGTPPPLGGVHELADPAFVVAALDVDGPIDLVVGIGASGLSALLVAAGGRARSVALVDGLGHPWRDVGTRVRETRERLRALAGLASRVEPGEDGLDPALTIPPTAHGDLRFAQVALAAVEVPLLVVTTDDDDTTWPLDPVRDHLPTSAHVERVADRSPTRVAEVVCAWATGGELGRWRAPNR